MTLTLNDLKWTNILLFKEQEKDECFKVELLEIVTPGAKLGRVKKTIVTIVNDDGKIYFCISGDHVNL